MRTTLSTRKSSGVIRIRPTMTTLASVLMLASISIAKEQPAAAGKQAKSVAHESASTAVAPDGRVGLGKGLMVTGSRAMVVFPEAVTRNPLVTGFQIPVDWAETEPHKGKCDWSKIDRLLAECEKYGKQAAFKFTMVGGKVMTDGQMATHGKTADEDSERGNSGTPGWLFDDPKIKRLGGMRSPKGRIPLYPVFWDPAYQKHLEGYITALAARYDGNPRIEYIRMAGWQVGTNEPSFYGGASEFLVDQLAAQGMPKVPEGNKKDLIRGLPGDGPYAKAVISMIDLWRKHFTKTRLAATIHFSKEKGSFEEAMMEHCLKNKIMIMNTGLNESDHVESRKQYREAHDQHGCKVAWGGITHLGSKRSRVDLEKTGHSLREEAVMQGIGDDGLPGYAPASKVSYLVFGFDFAEDRQAMQWAAEHLVK